MKENYSPTASTLYLFGPLPLHQEGARTDSIPSSATRSCERIGLMEFLANEGYPIGLLLPTIENASQVGHGYIRFADVAVQHVRRLQIFDLPTPVTRLSRRYIEWPRDLFAVIGQSCFVNPKFPYVETLQRRLQEWTQQHTAPNPSPLGEGGRIVATEEVLFVSATVADSDCAPIVQSGFTYFRLPPHQLFDHGFFDHIDPWISAVTQGGEILVLADITYALPQTNAHALKQLAQQPGIRVKKIHAAIPLEANRIIPLADGRVLLPRYSKQAGTAVTEFVGKQRVIRAPFDTTDDVRSLLGSWICSFTELSL